MIVVAVLLVGIVVLCTVGFADVVENYDGVTSWLKPAVAGSCCAAAAPAMLALLTWLLTERADRDH